MTCNDICSKYKIRRFHTDRTRYGGGRKRCSTCGIYLQWQGSRCPCCRRVLRTKPRNTHRAARMQYAATLSE